MGGFNSGLFHGTSGAPQLTLSASLDDARIEFAKGANVLTKRDILLDRASTEEARRLINELYRAGSVIGDGGTADAIREELANGTTVGGRSHIRKGQERLRQIRRMLQRNPNHQDRALLEELRDDLENALEARQ